MCLQSESTNIISRSALFTLTMRIVQWPAFCPTSIALLLLIQIVSTNLTTEASKLKFSTQIQRADVTPSHVFIFGLGYSGLALVSSLKRAFPDCVISGTCRSLDKADNLKKFGIQPFIFDPDANEYGLDDIGREALSKASHIVTMIPPISDFNKDPVLGLHRQDILNNVYSVSESTKGLDRTVERYDGINDDIYEDDINGYEDRVLQNRLDEGIDVADDVVRSNNGLWVGYVSTTGVYGDHSGNWVTEQSETLAPTTSNAFHRISAENEWLALRSQRSSKINVEDECTVSTVYPHVFRLGGIYGPGRSALDTVKRKNRYTNPLSSEKVAVEGQESSASGGTNWVSRIHVADICGAIIASMMAPVTGSEGEGAVYNVADNEPAPREVVMNYAENLLYKVSSGEERVTDSSNHNAVASEGGGVENVTPSLLPKSDSESSRGAVSGGEKMTSERTRRRLTENKRVSNAHIVKSLGYVFKYPSYKEGLQALLGGSNDPFE